MTVAQLLMQPWSLSELAILIVVFGGMVALVYVALKRFGIAVPIWINECFWIVVVVLVVVWCIKFLAGLW